MSIDNTRCSWLLDTGASITVVKKQVLPKQITVYKDSIVIKGIGGDIYSEGFVYLKLRTEHSDFFTINFIFLMSYLANRMEF